MTPLLCFFPQFHLCTRVNRCPKIELSDDFTTNSDTISNSPTTAGFSIMVNQPQSCLSVADLKY